MWLTLRIVRGQWLALEYLPTQRARSGLIPIPLPQQHLQLFSAKILTTALLSWINRDRACVSVGRIGTESFHWSCLTQSLSSRYRQRVGRIGGKRIGLKRSWGLLGADEGD